LLQDTVVFNNNVTFQMKLQNFEIIYRCATLVDVCQCCSGFEGSLAFPAHSR